jgi:acyl transferase domain-containing protein
MGFEPIAIVGRACLLPGTNTPEGLWTLVRERRVELGPTPDGRWGVDWDQIRCSPEAKGRDQWDRAWSNQGGYVRPEHDVLPDGPGLEALDGLDPLHRWSVLVGRNALDDAREGGVQVGELAPRTGAVFGNLSFPSSAMSRHAESVWFGEDPSAPVDPRNRYCSSGPAQLVAETLDLGRGAFCLDAACASALYAIKLAIDRLHDRDADLMLAGAVNRADDLFIHVGFCALQALSRSGRSRPFHADADGLVSGEGAGFVALMRLEDAERSGAKIHGVIRGVGLSNDGRGRGLLVPSQAAQARAMRSAWEQSGMSPARAGLLECHATGTQVGDAIEIASSAEVFGTDSSVRLPVSSLKSTL